MYCKSKCGKIGAAKDETEGSIMNNAPENTMPEKWVNLEDIAVYLSMSEDTRSDMDKRGQAAILSRRKTVQIQNFRSGRMD